MSQVIQISFDFNSLFTETDSSITARMNFSSMVIEQFAMNKSLFDVIQLLNNSVHSIVPLYFQING